jgi:type VI secretion system secreted protein Hcp
MALNAYLRLAGVNQGDIKGGVTQKGREGSIMVIAYNHEVLVPTDPETGLPAGKRKHTPLTILKEIDISTPMLMQMLIGDEVITKWELRFYQPIGSGQEFQHYTIRLKNARIIDIRQEMLNNKYPENMQHKEREFVSFIYQNISWEVVKTAKICEDNW